MLGSFDLSFMKMQRGYAVLLRWTDFLPAMSFIV
jgi:hypothetical protein